MDKGNPWIELDVHGSRGHSRSPSSSRRQKSSQFSTKPIDDLAQATLRNEQSFGAITDRLGELRKRRLVLGAGGGGGQALAQDPVPAKAQDPDRQRDKAYAFKARLETQSAILKSSLLRGAPASSVERVASVMGAALGCVAGVCDEYPKVIKKVSGAALTEMKQQYGRATREIQQAGREVERAQAEFHGRDQSQQADELVKESTRRVHLLRDELSASRTFQDLSKAARWTLENFSHEDLTFAAGSVVDHLEALSRAHLPEDIDREVECIVLGFDEWRRELERNAASAPQSVPPRALLSQIDDENRRRELETMAPAKALQLLKHTRLAISRVSANSTEAKKLGVIEQILNIRATGGGLDNEEAVKKTVEIWRLQKGVVHSQLQRLADACKVVMKIQASVSSRTNEVIQRMRDAQRSTTRQIVARTTQNTAVIEERWIVFMARAYAKNHADIVTKGTELAEAVVSSLEVFISKRVQQESEDASEDGMDDLVEQEQGQGQEEEGEEQEEEEEFPGRTPILEKVYGLIIDTFQAWCEYAEAVLDKCMEGTHRARAAVIQARSPHEKEFEHVSQM